MHAPSPRRARMTDRPYAWACSAAKDPRCLLLMNREKARAPASSPGVFRSWGWCPRRLTSAPASIDTVAAFRPWRDFRSSVARDRRGHHKTWATMPWPWTRAISLQSHKTGGERGIRTPEARFRRLHTFQACSFNHSDTSPCLHDCGRTGPQILAVAGPYHKLNLPAAVVETGRGTISAQTKPVARCLILFSPASGARSVLPNS